MTIKIMHIKNKISELEKQRILTELTVWLLWYKLGYFPGGKYEQCKQILQIFLTKINKLLDKYMPLRKISKKEYKRRLDLIKYLTK